MTENKNRQIAEEVLAKVGGKDNITNVTHCMTRLRLNLKDQSIPDDEEVKAIKGVLGVVNAGGQYQIIIGQNVPKVYAEICSMSGFAQQAAIDENLDQPKEKLTFKSAGAAVLNYMAGTMTPLLPILLASGMFKCLMVVFGDMLGWMTVKGDLYLMLDFMYNAGMYFIPVFGGYHAAKKIGSNPVLGMFLGAILVAPGLINIVSAGEPYAPLFGMNVSLHNYSNTILPILLAVAVMHVIEKFFKKVVPDTLSTIFVPTLTILVTTPIALYICGPAGYVLGDGLAVVLMGLYNTTGFLGIAVISALWLYLVMTGMHLVLIMPAMAAIMSGTPDPIILVSASCALFSAYGMAFGSFLRMKEKDEKSAFLGYFIAGTIGGVSEPALYGAGLKYKKPFIGMSIGGFCGGIYAGLTHVSISIMSASNVLRVLGFSSSSTNLINGCIAVGIAFAVSTVVVYFTGYKKEEIETGKPC